MNVTRDTFHLTVIFHLNSTLDTVQEKEQIKDEVFMISGLKELTGKGEGDMQINRGTIWLALLWLLKLLPRRKNSYLCLKEFKEFSSHWLCIAGFEVIQVWKMEVFNTKKPACIKIHCNILLVLETKEQKVDWEGLTEILLLLLFFFLIFKTFI